MKVLDNKTSKLILEDAWDIIRELSSSENLLDKGFKLDDISLDISLKLIDYRLKNNLTQSQLAKKLSMSPLAIEMLESGECDPNAMLVLKLSKKLKIKLWD